MKRAVTIFVAFAVVGALFTIFAMPAITARFPEIDNIAVTIKTTITAGWTQLQETLGAFGLGMGTMLTAGGSLGFLAISKLWSRAKENVEAQASALLSGKEAELSQTALKNTELTQLVAQKDDVIANLQNVSGDVATLRDKLATEKRLKEKLQQNFTTMEKTLQNTINELKQKEKIVVK